MRYCIILYGWFLLGFSAHAQILLVPGNNLQGNYIVTFTADDRVMTSTQAFRRQSAHAIKNLKLRQQHLIDRLQQDLVFTDLQILRNLWVRRSVAVSIADNYLPLIKKLSYVQSVKKDKQYIAQPQGVVSLPGANELVQDNLARVDIDKLWQDGFRGQGVVVAILDSGVDVLHDDLAQRWRGGSNSWFDPYGQHEQPFDLTGHGTAVASIVLGGNASGAYIGVAPRAQWIAARVFDDNGNSSESAISEALQWLLDPDGNPDTRDYPDIVQNSWGLGGTEGACDNPFAAELASLDALGIDLVFAVGNSGLSGIGAGGFSSYLTPAFDKHVISVGALQTTDNLLFSSSRGPDRCGQSVIPSVVAPGQVIKTADLTFDGFDTDNVTVHDGTSFSTPHVSGALALLRSRFNSNDHLDFRNALYETTIDLGSSGDDNDYGRGLVQVSKAADKLQQQSIEQRAREVNFSFANYIFSESDSAQNLAVTIIRSGDLSDMASVTVTSKDKTALNGEDYVAVLENIDFSPAESSKTINISLLNDNKAEPIETFELVLTLNTNVNIGSHSVATITITDDDVTATEDTIGGGSFSLIFLLPLGVLFIFKGVSKNSDFFVSARKWRAENRSV